MNIFGEEEFKPLRRYNKIIPKYFISKDGRILSKRCPKEKFLTPYFYKTGLKYGTFIISIDEEVHKELFPNDPYDYYVGGNGIRKKKSISRSLTVHQAVMWSWKPIDDYPPVSCKEYWDESHEEIKDLLRKSICVDHIDGDSSNNHIDNLLYTSQSGNNHYSKAND